MCGIAGIIDPTRATPPGVLREMLAAIRHRGPDGEGTHVEPGVAIGMRRLSVIDLATGDQPLAARGGRVLAFQNGEIYNYRALRGELERAGCAFATASDTEILAQGYDRWGIDGLLARIDGMYAIAILDRDARVLHLARDRFGEKPLFYAAEDGRFAYSSDLGTLAALPWVGAELDPLSLRRYLALHYVPGDATIYRHVRRVLPGERLEVALDAPAPKRVRATTCRRSPRRAPLERRRAWPPSSSARWRRGSLPTCPSACSFPAGSTARSSPTLAARHLPGVLTFSMGFASAEHDESEYARELADGDRQPSPSLSFRRSELRHAAARRSPRRSTNRSATRRSCPSTGSRARRDSTRPSCCRAKAPTKCSRATATTRRSRRMPAFVATQARARRG